MIAMPTAVPISKVKTDPTEVLSLIEQGPIMLTTRGNGVAVIASLSEWNSIAARLARLERHARAEAAALRQDFMDYEYADAG
jgi:prevent-host-death family protein